MSTRLDPFAGDKELLLMRSALCRLRLRRATHELRASLDWKRASIAAAGASVVPPVVFGLALSFIGVGRAARVLRLAGRIVVFAKLARLVFDVARKLATPTACATEQTGPGISRNLNHSRTTCAIE